MRIPDPQLEHQSEGKMESESIQLPPGSQREMSWLNLLNVNRVSEQVKKVKSIIPI
jgi:hypothetical protein